ncbi:hypothetical protein GCM10010363_54540 [Streptomyces omiyaensis]|uniref:hypothetical protein n=1 Tax=Streptomyces omiyaensis TaxID=68247 RepID=UPI0016764531|nr:hypothetical protein [Streptomyces omiyaensis]GGY66324.1 hypothetical protein GCM10010363_54540 [Streptomyces omiyaensis]
MSSHEPGQGWTQQHGQPQQGYPQGGPGYAAYGAPPPPSTPPGRQPSHRGAWIGAGATLVAAVIGVVGTYLVNTSDKEPEAAPAPAPTSATPTPDDGQAAENTPGTDGTSGTDASGGGTTAPAAQVTTSAPPTAPPDTVHWQGTLVIAYADDKDLDAAPPVVSEINSDNDFAVYPFGDHMLRPDNGSRALVWKGAAKVPAYGDCAGVVDTQATSNDIEMKTGLTVCGRTGEGRLLRMTVKELSGLASDTAATFDVVVWGG